MHGEFSEAKEVNLISYTIAEVRRLFMYVTTLIKQYWKDFIGWSIWRRKHQAIACFHHYQRRRT
jgi:hypothetical protein